MIEPMLIEVRHVRGGWSAIEGTATSPVFPKKRHAQNHALAKARYRIGAVHVYDESGKLERTIPFNGNDRLLQMNNKRAKEVRKH